MLWVGFMEFIIEVNLLMIKHQKDYTINLKNIWKERQDSIFKAIHLKVRLADRRNVRGSRISIERFSYARFESLKKHISEQIDEKSFKMKNGDLVEIIKVENYTDDEKVEHLENTLKQYLINKKKGEQSSKK